MPLAATTVKGRIRARLWQEALAAHRAGRVRVTEARASDFVGAGALSLFTEMVVPPVRLGKRALVPAAFDLPHSLSFTGDAGRTLAVLGTDERAWGRAWHVPTAAPTTLRQAAQRLATLAGAPTPRLATMPPWMLRLGGLFNPIAKEFVEMRYQFVRPFVLDSSAAQETFGLTRHRWTTRCAPCSEAGPIRRQRRRSVVAGPGRAGPAPHSVSSPPKSMME